MDARIGRVEALTARLGAIALPLGVILLVVSTIIHPSGEVMNNPVIFMVYAQDDSWIAVHFAQWFGASLFFCSLLAVYYSVTTKPELGAGIARFGFAAAALTLASTTIL